MNMMKDGRWIQGMTYRRPTCPVQLFSGGADESLPSCARSNHHRRLRAIKWPERCSAVSACGSAEGHS